MIFRQLFDPSSSTYTYLLASRHGGEALIVDPVLPSDLHEVSLRGLRVGGASVDLRFWRDAAGRSHHEVVRKRGTLHVVRQPPPESIAVGLGGRFRALVDGMIAA